MNVMIISNEEMKDIIEITKHLKKSGLLNIDVSKTIGNEAKEQKGGFLGMLMTTLVASLLGDILADKGVIQARKGTVTAGQEF